MTGRRRCPRCLKRIPFALGKCIRCGADASDARLWRHRRTATRRTAGAVFLLLVLGGVMAVNYSDRYLPAVADWYTDMVIRYLPDAAQKLTAAPSGGHDVFYFCARAVVKRMELDRSVVTFEGGWMIPEAVGEGRYRVRSRVDEAHENGEVFRHSFTCVARLEGRQWVLEELSLGSTASQRGAPSR